MLDSLCERRASASTPTDSAVAEKAHIVRSGAEELDKRGRTWVTPMPALATDALLPEQKKNPAIGAGLLFPSRKNPARPITSHLAGYWLKRAFEIGTLPKPAGTLWHGFRRKWATAAFSVEGCRYGRWVEGRADDDHVYQQPRLRDDARCGRPCKTTRPRERLLGPRSVTDTVTDTALDKKRNAMRA